MTAGVKLYLFGGFRLENSGGEVLSISLRKAEALLAYLAMAPGKTASREKLATLLWGESDQHRARQSLRQALFALTREFAETEVSTLRMESQMVSLDAASIRVDVGEFESLVAAGGAEGLAEATTCYAGGFLQGFTVDSPDFDDWLIAIRSRLEETALKAFVDLLDFQEEAGEISAGIETAQGALRIDGYREDLHRRLMSLFMANGMRSSALHQYRQCRDFLERELGVPPDAETDALYKSILERGPTTTPDFEETLGASAARSIAVGRVLAPLGKTTHELANTASAIGPRIDYDVLRLAADLDPEDAVRCVEELVAARILHAEGDELVFTRKRVRLALYESLLPQRRRALHAAVARAIEDIHAAALEPHFEVLARHHAEAGDAARGLEYDLAGGVANLKRGAWRTARKSFQRTLESAQGPIGDDRVRAIELDARLGLGVIAETDRDLDSATAIFEDIEARFDCIESPRRRIPALIGLSRVRYLRKDETGAYDFARRALIEAGRAGGDGVWSPVDRLLIRLHLIGSALRRSVERLIEARERARRVQLHEDQADAAAALGVLYAMEGDFTSAGAQCQDAVRLAEGLGNERCLAASLQFRGMVAMWQGAGEAALADFDQAGAIAEDRGDLLRLYTLAGHRGFALAAAKRYDQAMSEFKTALAMAARLDTKIFVPLFMAWRAEAAFEAGDRDGALDGGREACRMAAETNQPWARSVALRTLARVLAHPKVRNLSGAAKSIRSALADQEGLGIKFETARSMIVQAEIMRAAGDPPAYTKER